MLPQDKCSTFKHNIAFTGRKSDKIYVRACVRRDIVTISNKCMFTAKPFFISMQTEIPLEILQKRLSVSKWCKMRS